MVPSRPGGFQVTGQDPFCPLQTPKAPHPAYPPGLSSPSPAESLLHPSPPRPLTPVAKAVDPPPPSALHSFHPSLSADLQPRAPALAPHRRRPRFSCCVSCPWTGQRHAQAWSFPMAPQTALRSAGQRTEVCWTRKESGRWTSALAWIGLWCPLYECRGMRGEWSRGPVSVNKMRTDPT